MNHFSILVVVLLCISFLTYVESAPTLTMTQQLTQCGVSQNAGENNNHFTSDNPPHKESPSWSSEFGFKPSQIKTEPLLANVPAKENQPHHPFFKTASSSAAKLRQKLKDFAHKYAPNTENWSGNPVTDRDYFLIDAAIGN